MWGALVKGSDITPYLRALVPGRALSWSEAHTLAERQATVLLRFMHVDGPPVPQFVIASLPGLIVDWRADWPTAGMTLPVDGHYRIVICSTEPRWRQRFSLAHEYKHVLDDPLIERLYAHLDRGSQGERAERLCNYFAACLLMPRGWIKRDWAGGRQNVSRLARRYYVSAEAMSTRLSELGLTPMSLAIEPGPTRHIKETR
jgi:hypothetical protein